MKLTLSIAPPYSRELRAWLVAETLNPTPELEVVASGKVCWIYGPEELLIGFTLDLYEDFVGLRARTYFTLRGQDVKPW